MKLSISLSEADVAALDEHVRATGLPSRSAAVQRAIRLLAQEQLEADYAAAWTQWDDSAEREAWQAVSADGLLDEIETTQTSESSETARSSGHGSGVAPR